MGFNSGFKGLIMFPTYIYKKNERALIDKIQGSKILCPLSR